MTVTEQIQQRRTKLSQTVTSLEELRKERADRAVSGKPTNKIDALIEHAEKEVKHLPDEIAVLETKQQQEQETQVAQERQETLNQQTLAAKKIKKLSDELITSLTQSVDLNTQLLETYNEYTALREQTGQDLVSMNVTGGSRGMLQFLYELFSAETRGERLGRQIPTPCPPL